MCWSLSDRLTVELLLLLLLLGWFFSLTSCSADLISSKVTPWVERRVSRTRFACAFLWVSLSSSRTGGTKDLETVRDYKTRSKIFSKCLVGRKKNHREMALTIGVITSTNLGTWELEERQLHAQKTKIKVGERVRGGRT